MVQNLPPQLDTLKRLVTLTSQQQVKADQTARDVAPSTAPLAPQLVIVGKPEPTVG